MRPIHSLAAAALLAAALAAPAPGQESPTAYQSPQTCAGMPDGFDRRVDAMEIRRGRDGVAILDVATTLAVRNRARKDMDLSYAIEVRINSVAAARIERDALFRFSTDNVLANDAIVCAIQCTSECGSIFGDGTCAGCNCSYGFTASVPLPNLEPGDLIEAELVVLDGARRDERTMTDNRVAAHFAGLDRSLARLTR
jgi:hypothetical protein